MKKFAFSLFILLPLSVVGADNIGRNSNFRLPPKALKVLDKKFPGWKLAPVDKWIRQDYKKSDAELNIVEGDFDGNSQRDYALQIQHGTILNSGGKTEPKTHFVALMQRAGRFDFQIIDRYGGGDFLVLSRRGEKGYNWEKDKHFFFANDAVQTVYYEKAATAYIYERGKFRAIITSD